MRKVFSDKKSIRIAFHQKAPWERVARKPHVFIWWEASSNNETSTSQEPWPVFRVAGRSCGMYKLRAQSLRSRLVEKVNFPSVPQLWWAHASPWVSWALFPSSSPLTLCARLSHLAHVFLPFCAPASFLLCEVQETQKASAYQLHIVTNHKNYNFQIIAFDFSCAYDKTKFKLVYVLFQQNGATSLLQVSNVNTLVTC